MFLGYPDNHAGDVYYFLNLKTNKVILSKDVKWLNLSYKDYLDRSKFNDLIVDLKEEL